MSGYEIGAEVNICQVLEPKACRYLFLYKRGWNVVKRKLSNAHESVSKRDKHISISTAEIAAGQRSLLAFEQHKY